MVVFVFLFDPGAFVSLAEKEKLCGPCVKTLRLEVGEA